MYKQAAKQYCLLIKSTELLDVSGANNRILRKLLPILDGSCFMEGKHELRNKYYFLTEKGNGSQHIQTLYCKLSFVDAGPAKLLPLTEHANSLNSAACTDFTL